MDEVRNVFLFVNVGVIAAMAVAYWRVDRQRFDDWLTWSTSFAKLSERHCEALNELDGLRAERELLVRRAEWMARELRADEHHSTSVWPGRKPTVVHP